MYDNHSGKECTNQCAWPCDHLDCYSCLKVKLKFWSPSKNTEPASSCRWYTDYQSYETVHMWSAPVYANDSKYEDLWKWRKCLVCGTPDIKYLEEQAKARMPEQLKAFGYDR